jgi:hypothetical protein
VRVAGRRQKEQRLRGENDSAQIRRAVLEACRSYTHLPPSCERCFLRHATTANNTLVLYKNQKAPLPPRLDHLRGVANALQFTLVDCPGHASLIRTVIGGAQIIDLAVLVVDATKGACLFFVVLWFGSRRLVFFGLV